MSVSTYEPPRQIIAGDSIEFLCRIPSGYESWTGSARLTGASQMDATVTTEGSDFRVKFSGQATGASGIYKTAQLEAGEYSLTVWATNDTDRKTVRQYQLTIVADLATGQPKLAHAIKMLKVIEAAIEARVTGNDDGGIESYDVDGTHVDKLPMMDLQKLRNKYASEVQALQNRNKPIPDVKFAFTPTGGIPDLRARFFQ